VAPASPARAPQEDGDRTARARIRDAAIERFAASGVTATSLKAIAADVGVSPPLLIHHFGSKDGLRQACDEHVAAMIRARKRAAVAGGLDPLQALRESQEGPPLLGYLARTLGDGSPHVADLIDELVEDAVGYMAEGVEAGVLKPSDYPRERAVVLTLWQLGALVLHEHVERLMGADLVSGTEGVLAWILPAGEILAKGVLEEGFYERLTEARGALEQQLRTRRSKQ
jgi:AcrR family transcriptional regulator